VKLPPSLAVAGELGRALLDVARLPLRLQDYLTRHEALQEALREDLRAPGAHAESAPAHALPARPLRIFLSCAEASGEIHAVHLVEALRARARELGGPEPELVGLGGARLEASGVRLVGRPVDRAAMGIGGVLPALPYYLGLLTDCCRTFREESFDLFLPIDSPALHVPLSRLARSSGVRVVHFVAPQYWGWAPWRVDGYRAAVDLALTILPFEARWYARHDVATRHVGHPLLDALRAVPVTRPAVDSRRLVLLPGSRKSVIRANLPWMLRQVSYLLRKRPELEVQVLQGGDTHRPLIEELLRESGLESVELRTGDLHQHLAGARAAFSVSGTVLTDLMHHRLPTLVLYRLKGRRGTWMYRNLLTAPYFASVNLLAGREVLPELCFQGEGPVDQAQEWLERVIWDEEWRAECVEGLDAAARRLGPPGAVQRAASHALAVAAGPASPL
jgi:lipid-A-disaccharide synthase